VPSETHVEIRGTLTSDACNRHIGVRPAGDDLVWLSPELDSDGEIQMSEADVRRLVELVEKITTENA
jgi:hypothetical protein